MRRKLPLRKGGNTEYVIDRLGLCMCAGIFEEYFNLTDDEPGSKYTIVVTNEKPRGRHDNIFHLTEDGMGDDTYCFGPNEEDSGNSPWDCDFDIWLMRHFKGKDVYVWIE